MNFAPDQDQSLLVATVRRWAEQKLRAWAADADRAARPPDGLWAAAADLGLLADAIPADAGGLLDGPYSHLSRALRGFELGRGCAALAALCESNVEPALAVARWGGQAARDDLFGALDGGRRIAVTARDFAGRLAISRSAGGNLAVSGRLGPLPGLAIATHVLVAADAFADPILFLLPLHPEQLAPLAPSGWRAAAWGAAVLDQARVPSHLVLAGGAEARAAIRELRSWMAASLAARAVGVASAAIEHAAAYGEERIQFGQPIGRFESLARMRDENQTAIAAARLLVLQAAWEIDGAAPAAADTASRARDLAAQVVARATIDAVQMYGGYGFVNDFPVEKLMRDARAFEVLGGNESLARVLEQTAEVT